MARLSKQKLAQLQAESTPTGPQPLVQPPTLVTAVAENASPVIPSPTPNPTGNVVTIPDGYPVKQATLRSAGGLPVQRGETNGLFFLLSRFIKFWSQGGLTTIDTAFATSQGYKQGAVLFNPANSSWYQALNDNNSTTFDSNWKQIGVGTLTNYSTTLSNGWALGDNRIVAILNSSKLGGNNTGAGQIGFSLTDGNNPANTLSFLFNVNENNGGISANNPLLTLANCSGNANGQTTFSASQVLGTTPALAVLTDGTNVLVVTATNVYLSNNNGTSFSDITTLFPNATGFTGAIYDSGYSLWIVTGNVATTGTVGTGIWSQSTTNLASAWTQYTVSNNVSIQTVALNIDGATSVRPRYVFFKPNGDCWYAFASTSGQTALTITTAGGGLLGSGILASIFNNNVNDVNGNVIMIVGNGGSSRVNTATSQTLNGWTISQPSTISGNITCVSRGGYDQFIFGTDNGNLYTTNNSASNWYPVQQLISGQTTSITQIRYINNQLFILAGSNIYVGTINSSGIFVISETATFAGYTNLTDIYYYDGIYYVTGSNSGNLSLIKASKLTETISPNNIPFVFYASLDSTNNYIVVTAYNSPLTSLGIPVATGNLPTGITISADGRNVYVTNYNDNTISQYSRNVSTGQLTSLGTPVATGNAPQAITISADGSNVYVANEGSSTISQYSRNASTGQLTSLGTPVATGYNPYAITISADGSNVYVTNAGDNTISQYSRNASTGQLTSLGIPVATGNLPTGITISADGSNVYVTNRGDSTISQYSRNVSTGQLTSLGIPVATGTLPQAITISADGSNVYVTNNNNTISQYSRNASTGQLTSLGTTVATGRNPQAITISADGSNVYVANVNDNTISQYSRNASTGQLTSLGTPVATGIFPQAITISADGSNVYVTNYGDNTISQYSTNTLSISNTPTYIEFLNTYGVGMNVATLNTLGQVSATTGTQLSIVNKLQSLVIRSSFNVSDGSGNLAKSTAIINMNNRTLTVYLYTNPNGGSWNYNITYSKYISIIPNLPVTLPNTPNNVYILLGKSFDGDTTAITTTSIIWNITSRGGSTSWIWSF